MQINGRKMKGWTVGCCEYQSRRKIFRGYGFGEGVLGWICFVNFTGANSENKFDPFIFTAVILYFNYIQFKLDVRNSFVSLLTGPFVTKRAVLLNLGAVITLVSNWRCFCRLGWQEEAFCFMRAFKLASFVNLLWEMWNRKNRYQ